MPKTRHTSLIFNDFPFRPFFLRTWGCQHGWHRDWNTNNSTNETKWNKMKQHEQNRNSKPLKALSWNLQATHEALRTLRFVACALGVTRYTTSKWKGPAHFLGDPANVDDFEVILSLTMRSYWSFKSKIHKQKWNMQNAFKISEVEQPNFSFLWWVNMFKFLLQELEQSQDLSSRAEFRTSMFWHRTFPWGAGWLSTLVGCAKCHNLNPINRTWHWYIPTPS